MVYSEFRAIAYFSIGCLLIITLGALFVAYLVLTARDVDTLSVIIMLFTTIFFGYLLISIRKIAISTKGVDCQSVMLPFLKKHLSLNDVDYFVTQTVYVRGGYFTVVKLVKEAKVVLTMSARMYSNLQELVEVLPWKYRGQYNLGFFDEFRFFSINENKIS